MVAIAENVGLLSSLEHLRPRRDAAGLYQLNDDATGALLLYLKDLKRRAARSRSGCARCCATAGYRLMDPDPRAFWFKFETVNREDWTGQKLDVTNWEDEISFIKWTVTALDAGSRASLIVMLLVIIARRAS